MQDAHSGGIKLGGSDGKQKSCTEQRRHRGAHRGSRFPAELLHEPSHQLNPQHFSAGRSTQQPHHRAGNVHRISGNVLQNLYEIMAGKKQNQFILIGVSSTEHILI